MESNWERFCGSHDTHAHVSVVPVAVCAWRTAICGVDISIGVGIIIWEWLRSKSLDLENRGVQRLGDKQMVAQRRLGRAEVGLTMLAAACFLALGALSIYQGDAATNEPFFYFCEMALPWGLWTIMRMKTSSLRPASFVMISFSVIHLLAYALVFWGHYKSGIGSHALEIAQFALWVGAIGANGMACMNFILRVWFYPIRVIIRKGEEGFQAAGLLSRFCFTWMTGLLSRGYMCRYHPDGPQSLSPEDIPEVPPNELAEASYQKVASEIRTARPEDLRDRPCSKGKKLNLEPETEEVFVKRRLGLGILHAFQSEVYLSFFLELLVVVLLYTGPLILEQLVDYIGNRNGKRTIPMWQGYCWAAALAITKIMQAFLDHQLYFVTSRLGMHVEGAVVSAVYAKSLRLSNAAKQRHSTGEITNYMAVDAKRFADAMPWLKDLWSLPLQIAVSIYLLFRVVGKAMLAGLSVMVFMAIIQYILLNKSKKLQQGIMSAKDSRIKTTSDTLNAIKIIKFHAWEDDFRGKIQGERQKEYRALRSFMYLSAMTIFLVWLTPLLVSASTFAALTLGVPGIIEKRELKPSQSTGSAEMLAFIEQLPPCDVRRISKFLRSGELDPDAVEWHSSSLKDQTQEDIYSDQSTVIKITKASFSWDTGLEKGAKDSSQERDESQSSKETAVRKSSKPQDPLKEPLLQSNGLEPANGDDSSHTRQENPSHEIVLQDIDFQLKRSSLTAVCGLVGSGKSSLLQAILGELKQVNPDGKVVLQGTVAYVPQVAWIQNASVKENVLFGKPYDEIWYRTVIRACALVSDIESLVQGDETQIGEKGVTLSGGQKQRIQLARALYSNADIYLLDDIFSAVDVHTAKHIFDQAIQGLLKLNGKTIVLVTHAIEILPKMDLVLVCKEGLIIEQGTYSQILEQDRKLGSQGELKKLADAHMNSQDHSKIYGNESVTNVSTVEKQSNGEENDGTLPDAGEEEQDPSDEAVKTEKPLAISKKGAPSSADVADEEEREVGHVSWRIYLQYFRSFMRGYWFPMLLLVQTGWQGFQVASDIYLANVSDKHASSSFNAQRFVNIYTLLCVASGSFVFVRSFTIATFGLLASQKLFKRMLASIFRAPMSFFEKTPIGRILNRSTSDQATIDQDLPFNIGSTLAMAFQLLGIVFVLSKVTPLVLAVLFPLSLIYYNLQLYFIASSRELTRLESITRSPVINHVSESLSGASVIRAFQYQNNFQTELYRRMNANFRAFFHNSASQEWLGMRLEIIGAITLGAVGLLMVAADDAISSGKAGLSLSYGLSLTDSLFYIVQYLCFIENRMVSVERVQQYSRIDDEMQGENEKKRRRHDWPRTGSLKFSDLRIAYNPEGPIILKGINVEIEAEHRVGIVGRTGSGKSTLISALFRLVKPISGTIYIDGVDFRDISLKELRSKLSIIPQDPILFHGSLRHNIDPIGAYDDSEIYDALKDAALIDTIRQNVEEGGESNLLDVKISDGGDNWSSGQKQLLCMARALLRRRKVLVLDEATSSVDSKTDGLIQEMIRSKFKHCTILSIAHRVPTIVDSDRVIVLDQGCVEEYDSPSVLLNNPDSLFTSLVAEYNKNHS